MNRVERAEIDGGTDQESAPEEHADSFREDAFQQVDGNAEQHHAEQDVHLCHPRADSRQQLTAGCSGDDEWRTHSHAEGEQRGAAEHCVAGLTDVNERTGKRRGHAWTHDEGRKNPHDAHTDIGAPLQAVAQSRQ